MREVQNDMSGKVPTHADPAEPATSQHAYKFRGWSPEVVAATGDATYATTYDAIRAARPADPALVEATKSGGLLGGLLPVPPSPRQCPAGM